MGNSLYLSKNLKVFFGLSSCARICLESTTNSTEFSRAPRACPCSLSDGHGERHFCHTILVAGMAIGDSIPLKTLSPTGLRTLKFLLPMVIRLFQKVATEMTSKKLIAIAGMLLLLIVFSGISFARVSVNIVLLPLVFAAPPPVVVIQGTYVYFCPDAAVDILAQKNYIMVKEI